MKNTRIISAFPGMGKTYLFNTNEELSIIDSDSSNFSWIYEDGVKKRNPEFPENYAKHIRENIGQHDFILVSSHKEVRDALLKDGMQVEICFPSIDDKDIYLDRYTRRESPQALIDIIMSNWDNWITELSEIGDDNPKCITVQFEGDTYLTEYIDYTMKM